jgi:hypothetical protein
VETLLIGLSILPFLAGVAIGGQPMLLNDLQMDRVSAGDIVVPRLGQLTSDVQLYKNMAIPPHEHQPTVMYAFR